jgi:hypothetical protein
MLRHTSNSLLEAIRRISAQFNGYELEEVIRGDSERLQGSTGFHETLP